MARIQKLAIVDSLSRAIGDEAARQFADALENEIAPLVDSPQHSSDLDRIMSELKAEVWKVGATVIAFTASFVGVGVGIILAFD